MKSAEIFVILKDIISFCKANCKIFCHKVNVQKERLHTHTYNLIHHSSIKSFNLYLNTLMVAHFPSLSATLILSPQEHNSSVGEKDVFMC